MSDMPQMEHLQSHNMQLSQHVQEVGAQHSQLCSQLADLEGKHKLTVNDSNKMQQEIHVLRSSLQVHFPLKLVRCLQQNIPRSYFGHCKIVRKVFWLLSHFDILISSLGSSFDPICFVPLNSHEQLNAQHTIAASKYFE